MDTKKNPYRSYQFFSSNHSILLPYVCKGMCLMRTQNKNLILKEVSTIHKGRYTSVIKVWECESIIIWRLKRNSKTLNIYLKFSSTVRLRLFCSPLAAWYNQLKFFINCQRRVVERSEFSVESFIQQPYGKQEQRDILEKSVFFFHIAQKTSLFGGFLADLDL